MRCLLVRCEQKARTRVGRRPGADPPMGIAPGGTVTRGDRPRFRQIGDGDAGERARFRQIAALRITRRAALMAPPGGLGANLKPVGVKARAAALRRRIPSPPMGAALPAAAECPGAAVTTTGKRIELRLRALLVLSRAAVSRPTS